MCGMDIKKILIVDDEENIRDLIRRILGKEYTVFEAKDGVEAVDVARAQKPDLIFMDIMMPRMNGYDATYAIKADAETRGIYVIMLTGLSFDLNRRLAESIGADDYMEKPFDLQQLKNKIVQLEQSEDSGTLPQHIADSQ
jgi:CheY-like chemotaxis protein